MLFGPLLVFTPARKIVVSNRLLRAVVAGAQRKETRYTAFAVFCVVLATQVVVIYSLSLVLSRVFKLQVDACIYS